jgi:site-specific DNA-methyltransferase (adenine-specific)
LRFCSKVDGKEKPNCKYYSVKKVEAPDRVELDSGLMIRLLGVKPIDDKEEAAINFIRTITKGKKVFLKFDERKYDSENIPLAYLFLKNKTFVNMHLIKNRLAAVDTSLEYRAKKRLLSCYNESTRSGERA